MSKRPQDKSAEEGTDDHTPLAVLYENIEPKPGIYGTVDDARREIQNRAPEPAI
jgi:hypothetical protein